MKNRKAGVGLWGAGDGAGAFVVGYAGRNPPYGTGGF